MKRHLSRKHKAVEANITRNSNNDENFNPDDVDIDNVPFEICTQEFSTIDNVPIPYAAMTIITKLVNIKFIDTFRVVHVYIGSHKFSRVLRSH